MKHRKSYAVLSVLCVFFAAVFVFLCVWWFALTHPEFDGAASYGVRIPGLSDGISPQGLCTLPENDGGYDFAMSGYIEGEPSRVYLIHNDKTISNKNNGYADYAVLTEGGQTIESHFGGIACSEKYAYIASEEDVIVVSLEKLFDLPYARGAEVEIEGKFQTGFSENATCCVYDGMLVVAEFYHADKYPTDPSHHLEYNGETRHTLAYAYPLDADSVYGIADMVPSFVLSMPDEVQGMEMTDDHFYLSASYGLPDSRLMVTENVFKATTDKTFSVGGSNVPLLFVGNPQKTLAMPCMSEEICLKNGTLYVLFESQSVKYRFVVRTRVSHLMELPPDALMA